MKFNKFLFSKGFTLTELMAVVIILAILSAIAAGSYKKTIERTHFSEGLAAVNTIVAAIDRYRTDHYTDSQKPFDGTSSGLIAPAKLDIDLKNSTITGSGWNTKYFNISYYYDGVVTASRKNGGYSIVAYPTTFGSNRTKGETCNFTTTDWKDFCVSVGYTTCSSTASGTCSK